MLLYRLQAMVCQQQWLQWVNVLLRVVRPANPAVLRRIPTVPKRFFKPLLGVGTELASCKVIQIEQTCSSSLVSGQDKMNVKSIKIN